MSQVCPSSSHQLVAAAMAFRRARRKFPKNYGLCRTEEEITNLEGNTEKQSEGASGSEDTHEQEKSPSAKSNPTERSILWNDDCGENASAKENFLQKPIICSCCRKRNNQCSAGDTLDVIPSKEYNGIAKKIEFAKADQTASCDSKATRGFRAQPPNSSCGNILRPHSGRRSPKKTSSKLDSVNLLYEKNHAGGVNNFNGNGSSDKRNRDSREHSGGKKGWKPIDGNPRCTATPKKDNSLSSEASQTCHCRYVNHSTLDLLQPQEGGCRQNRNRCCPPHDVSYHCCGSEHNSCPSKGKRLASDPCLCCSNSKDHRSCYHKCHARCDSICAHDYCEKASEKISTVQEQNDEELDDAVGTIYHKDSLCILVEKYKANKKCKKNFGLRKPTEERFKEEYDKSFTSETAGPIDEANAKPVDKYLQRNKCRFRDNRVPIGKPCRHGQILNEEDCNQLKNLKSRLTKIGTCCSAKGTPWRHTF